MGTHAETICSSAAPLSNQPEAAVSLDSALTPFLASWPPGLQSQPLHWSLKILVLTLSSMEGFNGTSLPPA